MGRTYINVFLSSYLSYFILLELNQISDIFNILIEI